MRGLHIFPTHGSWTQTDNVHVFSTDDNYRLTRAHREAVQYAHRGILRTYPRDDIFDIVNSPETRQIYEDIQIYAEPYVEHICYYCKDYTFHYDWTEGDAKPIWACDECFSIGTWCATCYQNTAHTFIGQKDDWCFHCKNCDTCKGSL